MKKKNGFVTTGILFSLFILIVYLISCITIYTVRIKYNKKIRIEKTNEILDNKERLKDRIIYTK